VTGRLLATAVAADAATTMELGARLAAVLDPGDAVCLTGPLGAGKTTFTRGLAAGLGVHGDVASPTFVIARRHRGPRADLLHCDAYRVGGADEFTDLDLDPEGAVVVVEWGESVMAEISDSWLGIAIERGIGADDESRTLTVAGHGRRWDGPVGDAVAAVFAEAAP